ncbi:hypothetical protein [Tautonia marina]|uniref:hypothetical protein n=1 Tax=Tautonia marina TaxID=2653855 RepID=UPI0012605DC5|nr:hypothetical protein [Tautonia marina]
MRFGALSIAAAVAMGMALSATGTGEDPGSASAFWQLPDEAIGARLSPVLLLSRQDVQAELTITAEQAAAVERAIAELLAQASSLRGRSGPDAVAARRAVDEAAQQWIEGNLSADQQARLAQIDLQWQGASALVSRPTIAASLELTEDQQRRIVQTLTQGRAAGEDPLQAHHRMHRDAVSVLSEDQRLRWLAMIGSPFDVVEQRAASEGRVTR